MSEAYLIAVLERGEIPLRRIGDDRFLLLDDLMEFKRRDDMRRDAALDELARQAQELDLGY